MLNTSIILKPTKQGKTWGLTILSHDNDNNSNNNPHLTSRAWNSQACGALMSTIAIKETIYCVYHNIVPYQMDRIPKHITLHSSLFILHLPFFTLHPSTFWSTVEVSVLNRRNPSCLKDVWTIDIYSYLKCIKQYYNHNCLTPLPPVILTIWTGNTWSQKIWNVQ